MFNDGTVLLAIVLPMHFSQFSQVKYMLNKNSLAVKKCEANQKPQWLHISDQNL